MELASLESATDRRREARAIKTRALYRLIGARGWRKSNYFTDTSTCATLRTWLAARIPAEAGTVVSVGCGTAELERLVSRCPELRIIGMDSSLEMLQTAARLGSRGLIQADAHLLPFASGSCAGAMFLESIGHLHLESALPEIARVLNPRGWLLITTYSRGRAVHESYRKFGTTHLVRQLARAGFDIEDQKLLRPGRKSVEEVRSVRRSRLMYLFARKGA